MKRLLLGAAALTLAICSFGARPVFADGTDAGASASTGDWVNPILKAIPMPAGWHQRSLCFGYENTNQAWCLYFPFPN